MNFQHPCPVTDHLRLQAAPPSVATHTKPCHHWTDDSGTGGLILSLSQGRRDPTAVNTAWVLGGEPGTLLTLDGEFGCSLCATRWRYSPRHSAFLLEGRLNVLGAE